MSSTSGTGASKFIPDIIKGHGNWASGTTVRDIEGHFHKENEPQGAVPISGDGGVPNVDFKSKIKDAVTGHHSPSNTSAATGTTSGNNVSGTGLHHGSTTGVSSGSTGHSGLAAAAGTTGAVVPGATSSSSTTAGSGLTGATGTSSSAPVGSGLRNEHVPSSGVVSTTGTGTGTGTGSETHHKESLVEKVKHVVLGDDRMEKGQDPNTPATAFTDGHSGHHHGLKTGSGATTSGTAIGDGVGAHTGAGTSTHTTAGTGTAIGAGSGLIGGGHHASANTTTGSAAVPSSPTTRNSAGAGGLASELRNASTTNRNSIGSGTTTTSTTGTTGLPIATTGTAGTATTGATHGVSGTVERDLKEKERLSASTTSHSGTARTSTDGRSPVSPTHSNTATPEKKKESFFSKVKEALS